MTQGTGQNSSIVQDAEFLTLLERRGLLSWSDRVRIAGMDAAEAPKALFDQLIFKRIVTWSDVGSALKDDPSKILTVLEHKKIITWSDGVAIRRRFDQ